MTLLSDLRCALVCLDEAEEREIIVRYLKSCIKYRYLNNPAPHSISARAKWGGCQKTFSAFLHIITWYIQ